MAKKICFLLILAGIACAEEQNVIIQFLYDMLNSSKFENYEFLQAHCSEKVLKKLQADYDYECNEEPCYAVWDFREGANDVLYWKVLEVKSSGDGWYVYKYKENGVIGTHSVKATVQNGNVILQDFR